MVLNVTCHHDCLAPSTELACLQRMGCAWTNATAENKLQGLGQCRITSAQEFTGKAWIGGCDWLHVTHALRHVWLVFSALPGLTSLMGRACLRVVAARVWQACCFHWWGILSSTWA